MNGSENFTVPSFSGVLDGNGHTIYGLRRPLTADNTGTIQNLLAEAAFTADCTGMQGILVNENHGTITNCHVSGSIRGRLPGVKMSPDAETGSGREEVVRVAIIRAFASKIALLP